ncbi:MAG: endolytic transglycosylase MltG [Bacteroidales bacterium]|nr:endolytic transglycosylase MltG [Bacteroidales bacterium]
MNSKKDDTAEFMHQSNLWKWFLAIAVLLVIGMISFGLYLTNSKTENVSDTELLIYPEDDINSLKTKLINSGVISKNNTSFMAFSKSLKYMDNIKTGRYVIKPNMSIIGLVRKLRAANQQPVKLVITNARTADEFAAKISKSLMITQSDVISAIDKKGFKYANEIFEYVIPDTYEVYWNINADDLLNKLNKESDKFWQKNKEKLKLLNLTKEDAVILASIVTEETNKKDEMPVIAGVYINRLNKNMLLQADPTVKFAVGDFSIKRVTGKHLQIDSPFNTYKNAGLPPAPICLPSADALMSVLKYKKHDYIYFCAKEDFSGYHNFAKTPEQHLQNANRYRKALNQRGIH